MHQITLISTVHKETGKCTAAELCRILEKIKPEVIFLEALPDTYTSYEKTNFESFGVFHEKLEIKAIQKYQLKAPVHYEAVLDQALPESFTKKYTLLCKSEKLKGLIARQEYLTRHYGFPFLNSEEGVRLHDKMRKVEKEMLNGHELGAIVDQDIARYEDAMLRNIYSYCSENTFHTAVFMCGSAHRKSLIEKIGESQDWDKIGVSWTFFGS